MNLDSSDTTGIRNLMLLLPPGFAYYFAAWHHLTDSLRSNWRTQWRYRTHCGSGRQQAIWPAASGDAGSLIPNGDLAGPGSGILDQALYLPLFYGDAQGVIHPGAATESPTIQNGGVSADANTWTFHMQHLKD